MNREELITVAAEAVTNRRHDGTKNFHLCDFENHLCCMPTKHTKKEHKIFTRITYGDTYLGLTAAKWEHIGNKLKNYYKEATPCTQPIVRSKQ